MAFVAVAASVGTAVGLGGTAAVIGGGALIGAGVGGLYSAITGDGNILNSMLTGGLIGGAGAFGLGSFGLGGAEAQALMSGPFWGGAPGTVPMVTPGAATTVATPTPALQAAQGLTASSSPAAFEAAAAAQGVYPEGAAALRGAGMTVAPDVVTPQMIAQGAAPVTGAGPSGMKMLGYGLAGTTALSLLGGRQKGPGAGSMPDPGTIRPFDYESTPNQATGAYPSPYATASYDAAGMPILDTRERDYFSQSFKPMQPYSAKTGTPNPNVPTTAARGGIMQSYQSGGPVERMSMMNTAMNPQGGLYPQGMIDKTQYAMPIQRPVSSELVMDAPAYERSNPMLMAEGGSVKNYSFGGLALIENLMRQAEQGQMPKYQFDQANQSYTNVTTPQAQPSDISRFFSFLSNKQDARPSYSYDSSNQTYQPMAAGGMTSLGGYSDGGRMLKGPGDGMSDSIPASIGNKQPARLADGEFVVPADVVSHLGNGSTDAGAKRLYAMMDNVRKARTGNKKQGKQIKAQKYLPA